MTPLWLLDFVWPSTAATAPVPEHASSPTAAVLPPQGDGVTLWRSTDGRHGRAYTRAGTAPDGSWTALQCLQTLEGPAPGEPAACHYVVEADVAPEHDAAFNAWYEQEHLPGLARVPGTIRATRYRRLSGGPRYLACYDLLSPEGLERPEWLAVRHTAWSARIRPLFLNTRRTMFVRP